jgi:hypothetical protein
LPAEPLNTEALPNLHKKRRSGSQVVALLPNGERLIKQRQDLLALVSELNVLKREAYDQKLSFKMIK